ncbi:MAG: hypothetical protein IJU64_05215 [Bacilli bacterium]|nr:hypothetical protein [Bacilli bacterium]
MKPKRLLLSLMSTLALSGCSCSFLSGLLPTSSNNASTETSSSTPSVSSSSSAYNPFGFYLGEENVLLVEGQHYRVSYFRDDEGEIVEYDTEHRYVEDTVITSKDPTIVSVTEKGYFEGLKEGETDLVYSIAGKYDLTLHVKVETKRLTDLTVENVKSLYYQGQTFRFLGDVKAVYQNGYAEIVAPSVDASDVDMGKVGTYTCRVSYTLGEVTISKEVSVSVVDGGGTVPMARSVYDLDRSALYGGATGTPLSGTSKLLVIPVAFSDTPTLIPNMDNVRSDIHDVFFAEGTDLGYYSVASFYEAESKGKVRLEGTVAPWYHVSAPASAYYADDGEYRLRDIVNGALEWYFTSHPSESKLDYDADHDGHLDGVIFVYGATDYQTGDRSSDAMWAAVHSSSSYAPDPSDPTCSTFMWASYDFMYGSREVSAERTGNPAGYASGHMVTGSAQYDDVTLETVTFIHEMGHMFGLNDYYSAGGKAHFAGSCSMQDKSSFGHEPYSLLLYNWASPMIPESSITLTIEDFQSSHDVVLLSPSWNAVDSPFDEYLLVELYTPRGLHEFDAFSRNHTYAGQDSGTMQESGIRLWHVDARLVQLDSKGDPIGFVTDPNLGRVRQVADNEVDNGPIFGSLVPENPYHELVLIRNDTEMNTLPEVAIRRTDFFQAGDSFDMATFGKQFANDGKLNSGLDLGWRFHVDSISKRLDHSATATITFTKTA